MPEFIGVMPDLIGHLMIQRLPVKPAMTISSDRNFKMSFRATEALKCHFERPKGVEKSLNRNNIKQSI